MEVITRKTVMQGLVQQCLDVYHNDGLHACLEELHQTILNKKVKFPILEFAAHIFYDSIDNNDVLPFCDDIRKRQTEGGNVIVGILLQNRLKKAFKSTIQRTTFYLSSAEVWYVSDLIGERVYGVSLLTEPQKTIPELKILINHSSDMVVRALGAGIHYAIKKGLREAFTTICFDLLLSKANSKDKEIRQGIGWAAKTTAKFHPKIIDLNRVRIDNEEIVANWFRRKVQIGLDRHAYMMNKIPS